MARRKNPATVVLRARWLHYGKSDYILEVFVVGKWRSVHIHARSKRPLKSKDIVAARSVVWTNTGGRVEVIDLELEA